MSGLGEWLDDTHDRDSVTLGTSGFSAVAPYDPRATKNSSHPCYPHQPLPCPFGASFFGWPAPRHPAAPLDMVDYLTSGRLRKPNNVAKFAVLQKYFLGARGRPDLMWSDRGTRVWVPSLPAEAGAEAAASAAAPPVATTTAELKAATASVCTSGS
jgi:hypothetical protein